MTAQEKLKNRIEKKYHICIGLDSDVNKIPQHLLKFNNPILEFNKRIIESTIDSAAAYKINFAFYESWGIEGIKTLEQTIDFIGDDVVIIADAKRGDIGNTSLKYAESIFNHFRCDAVTLHPYMGIDSIEPFINYTDKISFILGLTSNKSSADFEKQILSSGKFLYQEVIEKTNEWNINNNCGLVFGATNISELKENIPSFNEMPILLPGVGAQGGSLEEVVSTFYQNNKNNFIINISRGLIYIDETESFDKSVKNKLLELNQQIAKLLM